MMNVSGTPTPNRGRGMERRADNVALAEKDLRTRSAPERIIFSNDDPKRMGRPSPTGFIGRRNRSVNIKEVVSVAPLPEEGIIAEDIGLDTVVAPRDLGLSGVVTSIASQDDQSLEEVIVGSDVGANELASTPLVQASPREMDAAPRPEEGLTASVEPVAMSTAAVLDSVDALTDEDEILMEDIVDEMDGVERNDEALPAQALTSSLPPASNLVNDDLVLEELDGVNNDEILSVAASLDQSEVMAPSSVLPPVPSLSSVPTQATEEMEVEDLDDMDYDQIAAAAESSRDTSLGSDVAPGFITSAASPVEQESIPAAGVSEDLEEATFDDVVSLSPSMWSDEVVVSTAAPTAQEVDTQSASVPVVEEDEYANETFEDEDEEEELSASIAPPSAEASVSAEVPSTSEAAVGLGQVESALPSSPAIDAVAAGLGGDPKAGAGARPQLTPDQEASMMREAVNLIATLKPSIKIHGYDRPANFNKLNQYIDSRDTVGLQTYLDSKECKDIAEKDTSSGVFAAVARFVLSDTTIPNPADKMDKLSVVREKFKYLQKDLVSKDANTNTEYEAENISEALASFDDRSREAGVQFLKDNITAQEAAKDKSAAKKAAPKEEASDIDWGDWKNKLSRGGMQMAAVGCLFLPGGVFLAVVIFAALPEKKKEEQQEKDAESLAASGASAPGKGYEKFMTSQEASLVGRKGASAVSAPAASTPSSDNSVAAPVVSGAAKAGNPSRGAVGAALDGAVADTAVSTEQTAQQLAGMKQQLKAARSGMSGAAPSIEPTISAAAVSGPAVEANTSAPAVDNSLSIAPAMSEPAVSGPAVEADTSTSVLDIDVSTPVVDGANLVSAEPMLAPLDAPVVTLGVEEAGAPSIDTALDQVVSAALPTLDGEVSSPIAQDEVTAEAVEELEGNDTVEPVGFGEASDDMDRALREAEVAEIVSGLSGAVKTGDHGRVPNAIDHTQGGHGQGIGG